MSETGPSTSLATLEAQRCKVFVFQSRFAKALTDGEMRFDQYAVHWWLQRGLEAHPWRVRSRAKADVIYFNASITYSDRHKLKHVVMEMKDNAPNGNNYTGDGTCRQMWFATSFNTRHGKHREVKTSPCFRYVRELDTGYGEPYLPLVAPFVVASPRWLTCDNCGAREDQPPTPIPWKQRKLLFLAGHVPLVRINNVRWNLWRHMHADPRVTLYSATLVHQVRMARACERFAPKHVNPKKMINLPVTSANGAKVTRLSEGARPVSELQAFMMQECMRDCRRYGDAFLANCSKAPAKQICAAESGVGTISLQRMTRECNVLRAHNVSGVAKALGPKRYAPVKLDRNAYLDEMMRHKFCVIAAGDDMSTHKIAETMAVASRGGCLPLIVGNLDPQQKAMRHDAYLPFPEHIDYCRVGFVVPIVSGRTVPAMPQLLDALDSVPVSAWHARRRAAIQLHERFVYRTSRPSAVDHIIAKMCAMAAEQRRVPAPVPVFFGYENKSNATLVTPPMCVPRGLEPYYEAIRVRHKNPLHDSWFSDRAFGRHGT